MLLHSLSHCLSLISLAVSCWFVFHAANRRYVCVFVCVCVCFIRTLAGGEECRIWRALPQHEAWPAGNQRASRVCPWEVRFVCICEYLCGRWCKWWDSSEEILHSWLCSLVRKDERLCKGWVKWSDYKWTVLDFISNRVKQNIHNYCRNFNKSCKQNALHRENTQTSLSLLKTASVSL